MACLSKKQIDFIRSDLKSRNVSRSFLFEEWVDHICCDVETLMNQGMQFENAYRTVAGKSGDTEVRSAQRDVQQFLNHRYVGIKKLLLFAFLVFAAGWAINLRWGINWISLASFLVLSVVCLRISVDFYTKRFVNRINLLLAFFSLLCFVGTLSGILLLFLHRNYGIRTGGHGVDLTVFGWFFFSIACLVYYMGEYRTSIEMKERRKSGWFATLAGFNVFLAAISVASFPLYRQVQDYLFYLIGSFMIVFIHSPFRSRLPGGKPKLHQVTLQLIPDRDPGQDKLFITMFYDRFPDRPITLPLRKTAENAFTITMLSYAYKGCLYYAVGDDSVDAAEYLTPLVHLDSLQLRIPRQKVYPLEYHPE